MLGRVSIPRCEQLRSVHPPSETSLPSLQNQDALGAARSETGRSEDATIGYGGGAFWRRPFRIGVIASAIKRCPRGLGWPSNLSRALGSLKRSWIS